jgi:hypothetical protein
MARFALGFAYNNNALMLRSRGISASRPTYRADRLILTGIVNAAGAANAGLALILYHYAESGRHFRDDELRRQVGL